MLGTRESYELYMGYANLLCKKGRYDEAVRMYNRVIQHRPTLVNAYVCIAMIHEYRRIEKSKSVAMAKQILDMDHNNMYAVFILARNIENVDQKIEKLKIAFERFPEYVRIANDVGIAYGTKK
jgi:tetratricopeptide (TPR) repeat protein